MQAVMITGISGALGRRVVSLLARDPKWQVSGIDQLPFPSGVLKPRRFTVHAVDLETSPLDQLFENIDAVIHLATLDAGDEDLNDQDAMLFRKTLDGAQKAGVKAVIALTSAVVYGAYKDNPIPLTESARVGTSSSFRYAQLKATRDEIVREWASANPSVKVALLRPAPTLGHPNAKAWLAKALKPSRIEVALGALAPSQFVHIDDVASAIVHCLENELDGVYNVAPVDWLTPEAAHDLFGKSLGLPIDERGLKLIRKVDSLIQGRSRPKGASEFSKYPIVISSDKLRSTGWQPLSTSAEAYVAARPQSAFGRLYARKRQEVTLAISSTIIVSAGCVAFWAIKRVLGRR